MKKRDEKKLLVVFLFTIFLLSVFSFVVIAADAPATGTPTDDLFGDNKDTAPADTTPGDDKAADKGTSADDLFGAGKEKAKGWWASFWSKDEEKKGWFASTWDSATGWVGGKVAWVAGYREGGDMFGHFLYTFFIGLVAGLMIWIVQFVSKIAAPLFKFWGSDHLKKFVWLAFIGGNWGRVFLTAFVYAVLMSIAVLNRLIEIVTLYQMSPNWFIKAAFLAFIIGFGPQLIKMYIDYKAEAAVKQNVANVLLAQQLAQKQGALLKKKP